MDPSTGKPKRFGFAEFESADGMLLAVRVLRDRVLASTEPLLVQLSAVAQRFLDFHVEQLKARARGSAGATIVAPPQPSGSAAPPTELPSEVTAEAEREALTKIEVSHLLLTASRLCSAHLDVTCRSWCTLTLVMQKLSARVWLLS